MEIDEKFKIKNIILNSDINIVQLKYKNLKIINIIVEEKPTGEIMAGAGLVLMVKL